VNLSEARSREEEREALVSGIDIVVKLGNRQHIAYHSLEYDTYDIVMSKTADGLFVF